MNSPVYLNALRAFEASARHKVFLLQQRVKCYPAAVGQLVRTLEDWLGFPLFHRQTNGKNRLVATELAESVLPDIRAGFDKLTLALEKLSKILYQVCLILRSVQHLLKNGYYQELIIFKTISRY